MFIRLGIQYRVIVPVPRMGMAVFPLAVYMSFCFTPGENVVKMDLSRTMCELAPESSKKTSVGGEDWVRDEIINMLPSPTVGTGGGVGGRSSMASSCSGGVGLGVFGSPSFLRDSLIVRYHLLGDILSPYIALFSLHTNFV